MTPERFELGLAALKWFASVAERREDAPSDWVVTRMEAK